MSDSEYESVLCAALLHDIGKFYQRPSKEPARHWKLSEAFVKGFSSSFLDPMLVGKLVAHHHESARYTPREDMPSALDDDRERALAYLVSRADSLASGERSDSDYVGLQSLSALHSVFSQVDIGLPMTQEEWAYPLSALFDSVSIRPCRGLSKHSELEDEHLWDRFVQDFGDLFGKPHERMADSLVSLIHKYIWCIPSDST